MKRVLFDTNVILDVLLERHPHAKASAAAWAAAESGKVKGMLAAHGVCAASRALKRASHKSVP